ncbi:MAG: DUF4430 domain-containing protein [bacterium]|nr:DUF4430 domain-containing protein [bacterium]
MQRPISRRRMLGLVSAALAAIVLEACGMGNRDQVGQTPESTARTPGKTRVSSSPTSTARPTTAPQTTPVSSGETVVAGSQRPNSEVEVVGSSERSSIVQTDPAVETPVSTQPAASPAMEEIGAPTTEPATAIPPPTEVVNPDPSPTPSEVAPTSTSEQPTATVEAGMVVTLEVPAAGMVVSERIPEGSTVWDFLVFVGQKNAVALQAINFPEPLGQFIGGISSVGGDSNSGPWLKYSVNGRSAGVGVSNMRLQSQDRVTWELGY